MKTKWNYNTDTRFWGNLPLDEQLELLRKWYPIGKTFNYITPGLSSGIEGSILGYVSYVYVDLGGTKYMYHVALDFGSIKLSPNLLPSDVHPKNLKPTLQTIREMKIESIL